MRESKEDKIFNVLNYLLIGLITLVVTYHTLYSEGLMSADFFTLTQEKDKNTVFNIVNLSEYDIILKEYRERYIIDLKIPVVDKVLMVICIIWSDNTTQSQIEEYCIMLEDLSYSDGIVATYNKHKNYTYILLSDSKESQLIATSEMVKDVLSSQNAEYEIGMSTIKKDISELKESAYEAKHFCLSQNIMQDDNEISIKDKYNLLLNELKSSMIVGDSTQSKTIINEIITTEQYKIQSSDVAYIFAEITLAIVKVCKTKGIEIDDMQISHIISTQNTDEFLKSIYALIDSCNKIVSEQKMPIRNEDFSIILEYIDEHLTENELSLDSVAEEFNISISQLSMKFKEQMGMNYKEYIIEQRVGRAKKLLSSSDLTVNEVCNQVGYLNVSHFIRNFKKLTNQTPLAYRKNNIIE